MSSGKSGKTEKKDRKNEPIYKGRRFGSDVDIIRELEECKERMDPEYIQVPLTKKESSMDVFVNRLEQIPGFKYIIFGAKALIENFVETGSKGSVRLHFIVQFLAVREIVILDSIERTIFEIIYKQRCVPCIFG